MKYSAFCSDQFLVNNVKRYISSHGETYEGYDAVEWLDEHIVNVDDGEAQVYVGTYGKYNDGSIAGAWVSIESFDTYEEFMDFCHAIHSNEYDPELMFQDFQGFPKDFYWEGGISEEKFDLIKQYCAYSENMQEAADAWLGLGNDNFEKFDDAYRGQWDSEEDFAEYVWEDMCYNIPDYIRRFINWKWVANDIFSDGYVFCDGYVFDLSA